ARFVRQRGGPLVNWWQVALLVGCALTVILETLTLWRLRRDSSEWAKRMRQQAVGISLMVGLIPAWLFLENTLSVLPYLLVLLLLAGFGITLFLRGGGWRSVAKP